MPKAIHAVRCGMQQVLHKTSIRYSEQGPGPRSIDNNMTPDLSRALPTPHILVQLGLAYMLHWSNYLGRVFESERGKQAQARRHHAPMDCNIPFGIRPSL